MHLSRVAALALGSKIVGVVSDKVPTSSYCVPSSGTCFVVNIPETTAQSNSGDIYFQISGPSTLQWIGLGQGRSMLDSNLFMVYADAAGTNVTLSPSLGIGNMEPSNNSTAEVTLLAGSGISNGMMIANVKCSNCNSWKGGSMSFTDPDSSWIWASKTGSPILTDSITMPMSIHDVYGSAQLNLVEATGGSDTISPFTNMPAALAATGAGAATAIPSNYNAVVLAHAVMACLAYALFFPLGAMYIRLSNRRGTLWVHASWMSFSYIMVLAAMMMGIYLATSSQQLSTYHAIIGLVAGGALALQPFTGLLHHVLYFSRGRPNLGTYPHVWWGRAVITLGIINGGFGLQLYGQSRGVYVAYGVVAGLVWVVWMGVDLLSLKRSRGKREAEEGEKMRPIASREVQQIADRDSEKAAYVNSNEGTTSSFEGNGTPNWPMR